ncbi:MAG: patatin-like phospholipase family protein [Patescibacteria group bacterium]
MLPIISNLIAKFKPAPTKTIRQVRILSIDGGGVKGVIPAVILAEIESRTGKPISQLFDLVAGTSTGGLITLSLTCSNKDGNPKFTAQDMVNMYMSEVQSIFSHRYPKTIAQITRYTEEKYDHTELEKVLLRYLGKNKISQSLLPVIVTSYDLDHRQPYIFNSQLAKMDSEHDYFIKDVARATSAAPTFFKPARVDNPDSVSSNIRTLIDGGVYANNPAMLALQEAFRLFPGHQKPILISIGTGTSRQKINYNHKNGWGEVAWVQPLLDITFQSLSDIVENEVAYHFEVEQNSSNYYRLQNQLSADLDNMDNSDPENMAKLKKTAEKFVGQNQELIQEICDKLTS